MITLDPVLQAVRQAAVLCQEVQRSSLRGMDKYTPDKSDSEPVTIADYGSQALICRTLQQFFPDDAVISEEAGSQFLELTNDQQKETISGLLAAILNQPVTAQDVAGWLDHGKTRTARRVWVIDPIDGTKGFIAMRHYAIGIGIVEDGKPTGSVMAVPGPLNEQGDAISGKLFWIAEGVPYREALHGGSPAERISVTSRTDDLRIVQSYEKKHASKERMALVRAKAGMTDARIHELDSMEKYAMVACGEADAYLRLPNRDSTRPHMSWDHAAGVALVLAAGGMATDVDGSELDFSQGKILPNRGMLVSNGQIHDRLVQATMAVLAEESAS